MENIHFEIRYGSSYSKYPKYKPPVNREIFISSWDTGLNEYEDSRLIDLGDTTSEITFTCNAVLKTRYYHIITETEAQSTTDVDIDLPEQIFYRDCIIVNSKNGKMNYGDHYVLIDHGWTLRIRVENVSLEKDMFIEIYTYSCPGFCDVTASTTTTTSTSTSTSTTTTL